jgi:hypothetical protein
VSTDIGAHVDVDTYIQLPTDHDTIYMDARIDSIDFYKDSEMTALVYSYKPPSP